MTTTVVAVGSTGVVVDTAPPLPDTVAAADAAGAPPGLALAALA